MLRELYVISEGGLCLYSYRTMGEESYSVSDVQLLSGLVLALVRVSEETFINKFQQLRLENEVVSIYRTNQHFFTCIFDDEDHPRTCRKISKKIASCFEKSFPGEDSSIIHSYKSFDKDIEDILRWKAIPKTTVTFLFGCIVTTFLMCVFLVSPLGKSFDKVLHDGIQDSLIIYELILIFGIPSLIGGFIVGRRWRGVLTGSIALMLVSMPYLINQPENFGFIDLLGVIVIFYGWIGGFFNELIFLGRSKNLNSSSKE